MKGKTPQMSIVYADLRMHSPRRAAERRTDTWLRSWGPWCSPHLKSREDHELIRLMSNVIKVWACLHMNRPRAESSSSVYSARNEQRREHVQTCRRPRAQCQHRASRLGQAKGGVGRPVVTLAVRAGRAQVRVAQQYMLC